MNEDQILSEYIDGELPSDVAAMVAERLQRDARFRSRFETLSALHQAMVQSTAINQIELKNMEARVWQRLQRNLSPRPSRVPAWMANLGDIIGSRVSLPVPALAGLAFVLIALGFLAVLRPAGNPAMPAVADSLNSSQQPLSIPSLGKTGSGAEKIDAIPAALNTASGQLSEGNTGSGMAVTIEVQNLRQLLSVLENNQGVREFTIQMPQVKTLAPVGDPALLSASELETGSGK